MTEIVKKAGKISARTKRRMLTRIALAHVLGIILVCVVVFVPNKRTTASPDFAMLIALGIMELLYILALVFAKRKDKLPIGCTDIISFVWILLLLWEITATKTGVAHPVLLPCPENVFYVFVTNGGELFQNVLSSLELLLSGFILGLFFGVLFGVICGWVPRLRAMFYPIANVFAPIPSVIFTPFLVILMPNYRMAAVIVILLGVFWPQFLNMILRVSSLPSAILDNTRTLKVSNITMVTKIILPYILPDVLKGVRVSLTTAFLMLMYAESFGAKSGIGFWITNANLFANYSNIYAGIITCGITVTILNYLTAWMQDKLTYWK